MKNLLSYYEKKNPIYAHQKPHTRLSSHKMREGREQNERIGCVKAKT